MVENYCNRSSCCGMFNSTEQISVSPAVAINDFRIAGQTLLLPIALNGR